MKKCVILILFTFICIGSKSQTYMRASVYQNNIWYPWEECSNIKQSGTYNQFIVHSLHKDPSHFYFRITINDFYIPDKKTRKLHMKNNEWYVFTGYIEYWIDDDHMDFLSCLGDRRTVPIEAAPWLKFNGRPSIIKKSPAEIQIPPYEKYPLIYTVWFEGIGYAFNFFEKFRY